MTRWWTALVSTVCALGTPCGAQETLYEGDVVEALLLSDGTVAVAEEDRLLLVRPSGRAVVVDGSFESVTRVAHATGGGVVVWDDSSQTAFVVRPDGVETRAVSFANSKLGARNGERNFVGLVADDVGLFEEVDPGNIFTLSSGPSRNLVRYKIVAHDGSGDSEAVVWEALGDQKFIHQTDYGMSGAPVIFGYGVLVANIFGGGFVVTQTEALEAAVLDAEGTRIGAIPLPPPGPSVSRDQIEWERDRLMAMPQVPPELEDVLSGILPPERLRETLAANSASGIEALRATPANTIPPRISALRVDRERRVWMRRFVPPRAAVAVWDVRPLSDSGGFSVDLPATWNVFDADGDHMLVGVEEMGMVTRVVSALIQR